MSEFKTGDKCKVNTGVLNGLGMGDLIGQRWTIKAVDAQGRCTVEMDHEDVEVSFGPIPPRVLGVWSEEDQRQLDAMPPVF